jgi:hypothetical protein
VYVTPSTGGWVLAIGIARYAFLAAGWVLPWMGATLPPRYWRKVVAAIQGIALTFAVADVLPRFLTNAVLAVSLALLAESSVVTWRGCGAAARRVWPVMVSAASLERTRDRGHHVAPLPSRVPRAIRAEPQRRRSGVTDQPGGGRRSRGLPSTGMPRSHRGRRWMNDTDREHRMHNRPRSRWTARRGGRGAAGTGELGMRRLPASSPCAYS